MNEKIKKPRVIGLGIAAAAVVVVIIGIVLFGGRLKAATMRLTDYDGNVALTDAAGKELSVQKDRKLLDGNKLSTKAESRAYVTLDEDRLVTLMQESKAAFAQSGKALELKLTEGQLFFNIAKSLKDDESLDIRTSTILIGIRGTSGYVDTDENGSEVLYLTSGKVHCVAKSPVTDDEEEVDVEAGQKLTVTVLDDGSLDVKVEDIPETALPMEAAELIAADEMLLETVLEETGWGEETLLAIANGEIESGVNGPVLRVPETVVDGIIHHEYYEVALGEQTTEWLDAVIEACESGNQETAAALCGYEGQNAEQLNAVLEELDATNNITNKENNIRIRAKGVSHGTYYRVWHNGYKCCVHGTRRSSGSDEFITMLGYLLPDTGTGYYFGVYTDSYKWGKCECVNGMYNGKFEINQTGIYETSFITGIIANGLYDGTAASESEYSLESFTTERNEQYARGILLESKWETTENGQLVGSGQETQSGELDNRFESIYYMGGTIPLDELPTGDEIEIYPY